MDNGGLGVCVLWIMVGWGMSCGQWWAGGICSVDNGGLGVYVLWIMVGWGYMSCG